MSVSPSELLTAWKSEETSPDVVRAQRSFGTVGADGGPHVLLLHGAGGSPADFVELGDALAADGAAVLCPLLPGHGRGEVALGELSFARVVERALQAFDALASSGAPVVVVGQSMGAAVGVHVCTERSAAGFVALAPAFRPYIARRIWLLLPLAIIRPTLARAIFRWQMEARRGIRAAAGRIPQVTCRLLVLHSRDDTSVDVRGAHELVDQAGSSEKRLELLDGQGHVLSQAPAREEVVFPRLREFVKTATAATRNQIPSPRP